MISQGNIESTVNSFAIHSKAILESAEALEGNARFAYAATPVIQPSTGDTLYYNITYDDLHIIKDHLGSVRVALTTNGSIRERNDYYPFGLRTDQGRAYPTFSDRYTVKVSRLTQGPNGTTTQTGYRATAPYTLQYNGKELQLFANTTLTDYGARQYNPTLARWTAQDPLSEFFYSNSSYIYCVNDPINFTDSEGLMGHWVQSVDGNIYWDEEAISPETTKEGELYTGNEFTDLEYHYHCDQTKKTIIFQLQSITITAEASKHAWAMINPITQAVRKGQEKAIEAVLDALNGKISANGIINNVVEVENYTIVVRGKVINGLPMIGTMFIK